MRTPPVLPIFPVLAVMLAAAAGAAAQVREPAWAGRFYDASPRSLAKEVDGWLAAAPAGPSGTVVALVAPHAGYVYSGRIAGAAWARVKGGDYDTVVIVGPSHRVGFEGCAIWLQGAFRTPLGDAAVDEAAAADLARASGFGAVPEAHAEEHSVEVQVPFLQRALPRAKLVPVVMGRQSRATVAALARGLEKALRGRKALVVASTDLSHQLPRARAAAVDGATAELVRGLKTGPLLRQAERGENVMCGGGPVAAALLYAKSLGAASVEIAARGDSADAGAPADAVVGYLSAIVSSTGKAPAAGPAPAPEFSLDEAQKAGLLTLARAALELFVRERKVLETRAEDPLLRTERAAFVTLRVKGGLRGCIGFVEPVGPLDRTVVQAAIYAASEDARFPPVRPEELAKIDVEVSVLTPVREVATPAQVRVGRDGIVVARGGSRGLLLPQVAVENGWDRETFLEQGCYKAGLPGDAWRKGAKVSVFQALVFGEK